MLARNFPSSASPALCLAALAAAAPAQSVFEAVPNTPSGPGVASWTENVDLGDIDQDGDWDAVFADGGSFGNDQNRCWVNQGGLQGGMEGEFIDQTVMRFPNAPDTSLDIEFGDIDGDGDLDLYVANTSQIVNQGCRWWVNSGGEQGGTPGFFVDETASRWVGLGQAGSSVDPAAVLPSGAFVDWVSDGDFGDLDNDGDLDLVHASVGGGFSGQTPTRIFLNDGHGRFSEFNPSGAQLVGTNISEGTPALWAEGVQQNDTNNSTGQFADIATVAIDVEIGDLDGDFDLDLLLGALNRDPRVFENRLEENSGGLGFRDRTSAILPNNASIGAGNYEQELGDFDGDGDLDLYGVNWNGFGQFDRTFRNGDASGGASGSFSILQSSIPSSISDDNEADFLDYDGDGDLDVFVADFSGSGRLYANDGAGTYSLVPNSGLTGSAPSLDADAADLDGDGDLDVLVAETSGAANQQLRNATETPDIHPPYLPRTENPGTQTASTGSLAVRAQVYDNAPLYVTTANETCVDVSVDGCVVGSFSAVSSGAQIFRAELPANLIGQVTLSWESVDDFGNIGVASPISFDSISNLTFTTEFGPSTIANATGVAPRLDVLSVPFAGETLYLAARGAPGVLSLTGFTTNSFPGGLPLPGLALVNVSGTTILTSSGALDSSGCRLLAVPLKSSLMPGGTVFAQTFTFDGATNGDLLASSAGVSITIQ